MRRIHQANDAVVHIARQVCAEIRSLELFAESRNSGGLRSCFLPAAESCARRPGIRYEHPNETISLLAGIVSRVNAINFQILICRERRNQLALTAVRFETPSVITALDLFAVKLPTRKRHASVRARILQSKRSAIAVTPDY